MTPIKVWLERAGAVESSHVVHVVVTGGEEVDRIWGDGDLEAFWRSSMKPFQALPLVEDGVFAELSLGDSELAIACASHDATQEHVAAATRILEAAGAVEDDLACGPHRPYDDAAARDLDVAGVLPGRLHNNCSGKHAGMIAWARNAGVNANGYHQYAHPVQQRIRRALTDWLDGDPEARVWGIDGCGVPTPRMSLAEMAGAYARFGASDAPGASRIASAMTANPIMVSGASALSSSLMTVTGGRLLAKEGAEGVFCVAEPGRTWGAAFKVTDGAMRAMGPAVVEVLSRIGTLATAEVEALGRFSTVTVSNTREEPVACLRVAPGS
ncbi:MAG: asparaginase [Gemmatimonadota bacterium]|nr:asparaginase [Gemmatimonadota bacterium]